MVNIRRLSKKIRMQRAKELIDKAEMTFFYQALHI